MKTISPLLWQAWRLSVHYWQAWRLSVHFSDKHEDYISPLLPSMKTMRVNHFSMVELCEVSWEDTLLIGNDAKKKEFWPNLNLKCSFNSSPLQVLLKTLRWGELRQDFVKKANFQFCTTVSPLGNPFVAIVQFDTSERVHWEPFFPNSLWCVGVCCLSSPRLPPTALISHLLDYPQRHWWLWSGDLSLQLDSLLIQSTPMVYGDIKSFIKP